LWQRVTGSVRAIRPSSPLSFRGGAGGGDESQKYNNFGFVLHVPAPTPPLKGRGSTSSNTLDGSWDKKLGTGAVAPDRTIDLHGYNLAAAHHRLDLGLDHAIRDGARVILLVTGRPPRAGSSRLDLPLRGIIRESVGDWLASSRHASAIAAIRNAHPRHGGAGALYIVLRRNR
jgi:DNA-nicking Smr family endonuclease